MKHIDTMLSVFQRHSCICQVIIWTPEGPISYASESLIVIFLPWYNCYVYVLNGNKMFLNWRKKKKKKKKKKRCSKGVNKLAEWRIGSVSALPGFGPRTRLSEIIPANNCTMQGQNNWGNSDLSNMAELPSFSPPASESTLQYRTSPPRQARMRPKIKAAPVYI